MGKSPKKSAATNGTPLKVQVQDQQATGDTNNIVATVLAASPKLPTFIPDDPILWLETVEEEFTVTGVTTSSTKYSHLMRAIPEKYQIKVRDLIVQKPERSTAYERLKAALLRALQLTDQQRWEKMLALTLGDDTASDLLSKMFRLHGSTPGPADYMFRSLFIGKLPKTIRGPLWDVAPTLSFRELAEKADRYIQGMSDQERAQVLVVSVVEADDSSTFDVLAASSSRGRGYGRGNSGRGRGGGGRGRGANAASGQSSGADKRNWCWYHWRYGPEAQKCPGQPDCSFKPSGNATSGK